VVLLCIVAVIVFANLRPDRADGSRIADTREPFAAGLSLESVRFDGVGSERRVAGVLKNSGSEPRRNVTVRFAMWKLSTGRRTPLEVTVPLVPANGGAEFHTEIIPPDIDKCNLEAIEAAP
jgi:hypothetical protein